eukprot:NODE_2723_length_1053_cov_61.954183_g2271_i0.p1 GENE.NODE_2723_length_1053_cov_61.954183_g2271_i0~~NODE_2723_length_1053_cov_61.954183_g2271_i0.p1  ORF type:complete len:221 (+),score=49.11 NODE_2723_length_1053_cov_61.954183_g2271_i0:228-890(+)
MQRFFGKSKPQAPPPTLGETSERLDKRGNVLDSKITTLDQQLAQCRDEMGRARGPAKERIKQRAMQLLKQRKMYEGQRGQLYNQQMSVDQLAFTQEATKDAAEQMNAMKGAAKHLKKEYKKMNVDDADRLADELDDLYWQGQDLQEALGRQYGVPDEITDADLDAELGALDMDGTLDSSYLDEALNTPGGMTGPIGGQPAPAQPEVSDPGRLEEQLGLGL